ncbi:MAG: hypothetical protein GPOALKHO_000431 [Sodalis sp.]|nr:MAG: hypothetical protein GPOALKHO_000431 [Sodalis sp.]
MDYGLHEFKFSPAEANGGVKALQALPVRSHGRISAKPADIAPANLP